VLKEKWLLELGKLKKMGVLCNFKARKGVQVRIICKSEKSRFWTFAPYIRVNLWRIGNNLVCLYVQREEGTRVPSINKEGLPCTRSPDPSQAFLWDGYLYNYGL
jgi:hypothetical protein